MKTSCLAALFTGLSYPVLAQSGPGYRVQLDLTATPNDQVRVVVNTPKVREAQATYVVPATVPGTYSRDNYGRFVRDFRALDKKGRALPTQQLEPGVFRIDQAKKLARLEYLVDDTWDVPQDSTFIFQPAGTNFDAGRSFVLNQFGLYGYLEGHKMQPYEVTVTKPADLHGATALAVRRPSPTQDVFTAPDYVALADGPVLYSRPDTTSFRSGGANIRFAVFSESGQVKARQLARYLRPTASALASFFGQMPVPQYQFLFYFVDPKSSAVKPKDGKYGALEHSYSSLYFLPEIADSARLKKLVLDVASHEFLHVLTPLNVHSREIGEFDFRNPKMSQHLWLYEGTTEYFAHLAQVRAGLITPDEFRQTMRQKIVGAQRYPSVSFTEMSRNILVPPYKDMYSNVYEKGALLAFLLDIRIRELSQGRQSLRDVVLKLREKYGPTRSFEDDQLIPEIVALTHPEVQQFFDRYVVGKEPLPLEEYLGKIGWQYVATGTRTERGFGQFGFQYNPATKQFVVAGTSPERNAFGLRPGDAVLAVNGTVVEPTNAQQLLRPLLDAASTPVTLRVQPAGAATPEDRKGQPRDFQLELKNVVQPLENPTPVQAQLQKQVLTAGQ
ncbi:M61 family metallopeptidase [Hymenobacter weizhouensis]|uniref:M61 family metallopeptidase n=1 Tax=Hymenobacter sp. YIM 151500-1 TaxID=2987689 RepID=UPI002226116D|nr:peptidase M61 [Hymenobacter sp. YIM 151500-1]UYZ61649.1 peptidase M61 [Hymenobacter sp. YIM 151500-1]